MLRCQRKRNLHILPSLPSLPCLQELVVSVATRVTRRFRGKNHQSIGKVAKTVTQPKITKIYTSKFNLKVKSIYIKPLLNPKIPAANHASKQLIMVKIKKLLKMY
jgi:hypothetical protein